jgi:uncharacterized membrane protein (UPF0127 family)
MSRLIKYAPQSEIVIAANVRIAEDFFSRAKGLLGEKSLQVGSGLWIKRCSSIHTFFMQFPIDVIFVDRHLRVKGIYNDLQPWRATFPIWKGNSVFELPAGTLAQLSIKLGDQLDVRD